MESVTSFFLIHTPYIAFCNNCAVFQTVFAIVLRYDRGASFDTSSCTVRGTHSE